MTALRRWRLRLRWRHEHPRDKYTRGVPENVGAPSIFDRLIQRQWRASQAGSRMWLPWWAYSGVKSRPYYFMPIAGPAGKLP